MIFLYFCSIPLAVEPSFLPPPPRRRVHVGLLGVEVGYVDVGVVVVVLVVVVVAVVVVAVQVVGHIDGGVHHGQDKAQETD